MAVTQDILKSYRKPGQVMARHLAAGQREDRALIFLMASCLMFFLAELPVLSRNAHLQGTDMGPELGGSLLAWIFIAPLILYALAAVLRIVMRVLGCKLAGWFEVRLALFWSLLAASPLVLLNGLTKGFIGQGVEVNIVGFVWLVSFLWILAGGLRQVCKGIS